MTIDPWPVIAALVLSILAVSASCSRTPTDLKSIPIAYMFIGMLGSLSTGLAIRSMYADWKGKDDVDVTQFGLSLIVSTTAFVLFKMWCDQNVSR